MIVGTCLWCGHAANDGPRCPRCGTVAIVRSSIPVLRLDEDDDVDRPYGETDDEPPRTKSPPSGLIREGTVGVPRRFGTIRVLAVLPIFALIFGIMQWLGAPPSMFLGVTLFVVLVGAGQAVLFGGTNPRRASFVSGLVAGPIVALLMALLAGRVDGPREINDPTNVFIVAGLFALFGGPFGYLAGGLIAGIFLVRGRDLDEDAGPPDADAETQPPTDPFGD